MLIVDAQVHIWSSGKPTNPNHRQVERFTQDLGAKAARRRA